MPHLYHVETPGFGQEVLRSTLVPLWSCGPLACSDKFGKVRKNKVWLEHLHLLEQFRDSEVDHCEMMWFMLERDVWPNVLRTVGTIKAT